MLRPSATEKYFRVPERICPPDFGPALYKKFLKKNSNPWKKVYNYILLADEDLDSPKSIFRIWVFFTQKNNLISYVWGTSFLQKLSHDKDDAWDNILERHCGCCRYIQSCRDRLHCVLTFVHQSDGRSWETSFSLRNFLYTLYAFIYFQRASEFFPREEGTRKSFSVADGLTDYWV